MIEGKNISFTHKTFLAINNAFFKIKEGHITVFMGQSGAGKTTLLKCIANLYSHYNGTIAFGAKDLKNMDGPERAVLLGCVLQQFHLFPHLTVLQNCALALKKVFQVDKKQAEEKALSILQQLGMDFFIGAFPSELSGGQQQKVAIARALVLSPKVLLLDEPTSALDPESRKNLVKILLDLKSQGMSIVLSSHDMSFIRMVADLIYFIEKGAIIESWEGEEVLESKEKIHQFLTA